MSLYQRSRSDFGLDEVRRFFGISGGREGYYDFVVNVQTLWLGGDFLGKAARLCGREAMGPAVRDVRRGEGDYAMQINSYFTTHSYQPPAPAGRVI